MPIIPCECTFIASFCFSEVLGFHRTPGVGARGTQTLYYYASLAEANQEQTAALFLLIWQRSPALEEKHIMLLDENWKHFTQEATGNLVCPAHDHGTILPAAVSQFRDEVLSPDN